MKKLLFLAVLAVALVACKKDPQLVISEYADQTCKAYVGHNLIDELEITSVSYTGDTLLFVATLSDQSEHDLGLIELTYEENLYPEVNQLVTTMVSTTVVGNEELTAALAETQSQMVFRFVDSDGNAFDKQVRHF